MLQIFVIMALVGRPAPMVDEVPEEVVLPLVYGLVPIKLKKRTGLFEKQ